MGKHKGCLGGFCFCFCFIASEQKQKSSLSMTLALPMERACPQKQGVHRACLKSVVVALKASGLPKKKNGLCYSEVLQDKGSNRIHWRDSAKDSEIWLNFGSRVAESVSNSEVGMV